MADAASCRPSTSPDTSVEAAVRAEQTCGVFQSLTPQTNKPRRSGPCVGAKSVTACGARSRVQRDQGREEREWRGSGTNPGVGAARWEFTDLAEAPTAAGRAEMPTPAAHLH